MYFLHNIKCPQIWFPSLVSHQAQLLEASYEEVTPIVPNLPKFAMLDIENKSIALPRPQTFQRLQNTYNQTHE